MINYAVTEIPTSTKQDETLSSSPYAMIHMSSDPGVSVTSGNEEHSQQLFSRSHSDMLSAQNDPEFDVQPSMDRIPGSSYSNEDHTPFSWVNVTGQ